MPRAYLRLDPNFPDHKESYPDGALAAFVLTLCLAEQQPRRGRFKSERLLRLLLGKRARWVPFLIRSGDLLVQNPPGNGELYVDGWDEWQEGDVTVWERMARLRARKTVTNGVTPTVTGSVNSPSSGGGGDGAEATAEAGKPSPTWFGYPPRKPAYDPEGGSGLWHGVGTHDGRHGKTCTVCFPPKAQP